MSYKQTLQVFEVFDRVENAKTNEEKIEWLQKHNVHALRDVLRGTFDTVIEWNLPPGEPPYQANIPESVPSSLLKQHTQFKYFVKGPVSDGLTSVKREQMFIRLLEAIHPADAKVVIKMINNEQPSDSITKELVEEAFPTLILK